jgi:hypothetical protein
MLPVNTSRKQDFAEFCAAAMSAGRYDLIVDQYRYPFTAYLHGTPHVLHSPREAWAFYQTLHSAMRCDGFDTLTARVTAQDMPRRLTDMIEFTRVALPALAA